MRADLQRGVLLGAPLGYLIGLAVYGGIGYLVAGQTGLAVGAVIATAFAVAGLVICLRFVRAFTTTEVPF
jgi:hypothetical protein